MTLLLRVLLVALALTNAAIVFALIQIVRQSRSQIQLNNTVIARFDLFDARLMLLETAANLRSKE